MSTGIAAGGAYLHTTDLAADGLGKLVYKLYLTRIFVWSRGFFHMILKFFDKVIPYSVFPLLCKHDGGFDNLTSYRIR